MSRVPRKDDLPTMASPFINVLAFGADPTGLTDSTTAIQAAITEANNPTALDSSVAAYTWITQLEGGVVYFPRGWYLISSVLTMSDRVSLVGENWTSCGIVADSAMTDVNMLNYVDSTNAMFDCRIENLRLHANNNSNITHVVRSQALQEGCGLVRASIDGYQGEGILIEDVSSGAARFWIQDCTFGGFSNNTAAIHVESSVPNSFSIQVTQTTINPSGVATNGIHVENGRLYARDVHIENATNGIHLEGGNAILKNISGASTTVNTVTINASFGGSIEMEGIDVNGGTLSLDDNVTSRDIAQTIPKARYPFRPQFTDQDATPSVASQAPVYRTLNTGATTITDFDSGVSGQSFRLRFQDALTTIDCSSNANITRVDSAGVDISGASGDWCDVWDDGGVWFVVFHDATP